jgi:hypothetical protein
MKNIQNCLSTKSVSKAVDAKIGHQWKSLIIVAKTADIERT